MAITIIGGEMSGRRLNVPATREVRPMGQRVKQVLFDTLGNTIYEARILDLFSGAGSFMFEAISRGAMSVTAVERLTLLADALYKNAALLQVQDQVRIYEEDIKRFFDIVNPELPYDVVFIDPPFGSKLLKQTTKRLVRWTGTNEDTLFVIRTFKKEKDFVTSDYLLVKEKMVGDDRLSFYYFSPPDSVNEV